MEAREGQRLDCGLLKVESEAQKASTQEKSGKREVCARDLDI